MPAMRLARQMSTRASLRCALAFALKDNLALVPGGNAARFQSMSF